MPYIVETHHRDNTDDMRSNLRSVHLAYLDENINESLKPDDKLKLQKTVKVKPTKPFAFDPTFHKPDHFTSGDNYWEQGIRWQTWNWQGKPLGIKFSNKGTLENPLVEIKIYANH